MKKITISIFIISFAFFLACNKEDSIENKSFDVINYHQSFVNDIITPSMNKFVSDVKNLNDAITNFTSNTNETNLSTLRNSWKKTGISFAKTEIGNLGEIQTSAIYLSINSWGANETKIEEFILSSTVIAENKINTLPTKSRGLSAIEYLIFEEDLKNTIIAFSNQRRKEFLIALGENVSNKANSLDNKWKNYSSSFINNISTGINGTINNIVNQMNFLLENVRRFKVGEPAGLENSSTVDVTLLEADKSGISLDIIKENIASIKASYYGNTEGLDDFVSSIIENEDINNAIQNQFSKIENSITSLSNSSLKKAILNKNTQVKILYDDIKDLILLIKVDVASTLSITVTFTDNDGD